MAAGHNEDRSAAGATRRAGTAAALEADSRGVFLTASRGVLRWAGLGVALMALIAAGIPGSARAQTAADSAAALDVVPLDLGEIPPDDVVPMAAHGVEKALEALPGAITDILKRSGVPGAAVAVVYEGKTVFAQGFGEREKDKGVPVDTDTVFQIASLSKPIAATIAAIQVTAGVVKWDDKVVKYLPDFTLASPYVTQNATIGDFYAHRTGLPLAAGDDLEDIGLDRGGILTRLHLLPLDAFRTSYHYANFGITVGAVAVAKASGETWENLAQRALFKPLGMASTSYRYADFLERRNRATLHALVGGRFQPLYTRNADAQAPAGGVSSSVNDMTAWMKLVLASGRDGKEEMISRAALVPALRPQAFSGPAATLDARSSFYGYGFGVGVNANGRTAVSHSGAFALGAATNVQFLPSANLAIVVLTNAGPVGAAEAIASQFMDIAQFGVLHRDWYALMHPVLMHYYDPAGDLVGKSPPANAQPARPLADYVGTYKNDYFGPAEIRAEGGGLVFHVGPGHFTLPMTHWDGDTFSVAPRDENATEGSLSSLGFVVKDGKVVSFTVDYLDANGMATWSR